MPPGMLAGVGPGPAKHGGGGGAGPRAGQCGDVLHHAADAHLPRPGPGHSPAVRLRAAGHTGRRAGDRPHAPAAAPFRSLPSRRPGGRRLKKARPAGLLGRRTRHACPVAPAFLLKPTHPVPQPVDLGSANLSGVSPGQSLNPCSCFCASCSGKSKSTRGNGQGSEGSGDTGQGNPGGPPWVLHHGQGYPSAAGPPCIAAMAALVRGAPMHRGRAAPGPDAGPP